MTNHDGGGPAQDRVSRGYVHTKKVGPALPRQKEQQRRRQEDRHHSLDHSWACSGSFRQTDHARTRPWGYRRDDPHWNGWRRCRGLRSARPPRPPRGRVRLVDRGGDPGGDHTTRYLPSAGGPAQGLSPLSVERKDSRKRGVAVCQDQAANRGARTDRGCGGRILPRGSRRRTGCTPSGTKTFASSVSPDLAARWARQPAARAEASTTTMKSNSRGACTEARSTRATCWARRWPSSSAPSSSYTPAALLPSRRSCSVLRQAPASTTRSPWRSLSGWRSWSSLPLSDTSLAPT